MGATLDAVVMGATLDPAVAVVGAAVRPLVRLQLVLTPLSDPAPEAVVMGATLDAVVMGATLDPAVAVVGAAVRPLVRLQLVLTLYIANLGASTIGGGRLVLIGIPSCHHPPPA